MDDTLYTRQKKEQNRIKKIYKNLPKEQLEIAKKLIERAAYMLVSLEDMEAKISADGLVVTMPQGNYEIERAHPLLQPYNAMVKNYNATIKPNPYTTAYKFYYRLATQYKLYNNAFVYPVWNEVTGKLEALYNINANSVELIEVEGELYCRMTFATGNVYTCPYTDLIHIGSHFNNNDIFGENNRPVFPVLETANTFNQSMSKFAELVAVVRGILKIQASTKNEDLNARRDDFIRDNLKMENNGAGVIVTDNKYDYTPITDKQTPIPTGQLSYVKAEIYDYFGTNEPIVQNKETPEQASAFYNGEIKPFFEQCTQAFTNAFFSGRQPAYGNEIVFEGNCLQNEKLSDKTTTLKFLADIGAITIDQVLLAYNMAPLGGEEGARRVQTLNMVNAAKADEYQLGAGTTPPKSTEDETTPTDPPAEDPDADDDQTEEET